jgi:DNA invertase Pin-like site-specific DNA recombinase
VLLVDDTSRLTRNLGDNLKFAEEMRFLGIRVIAVSQGFDTNSEQSELVMAVHGIVDSVYIKDLGQKTRRGLIDTMEKGLHTGGRTYGYDSIPVDDGRARKAGETFPARLQINETEAKVEHRIFTMFADGASNRRLPRL